MSPAGTRWLRKALFVPAVDSKLGTAPCSLAPLCCAVVGKGMGARIGLEAELDTEVGTSLALHTLYHAAAGRPLSLSDGRGGAARSLG